MAAVKLYLVFSKSKPLWLTDCPDSASDDAEANPGCTFREATEADLTAKLVAEYLDQQCENRNYHDFCGVHAALAKLLREKVGKEHAAAILRAILHKGGLDKMRAT